MKESISPRLAMSQSLHHAGFILEDAERVMSALSPALPDALRQNTDHLFYDFSRSLRIIARQEQITDKQARQFVMRDPFALFEVHDIKPHGVMPANDPSPAKTSPGKRPPVFTSEDQLFETILAFVEDRKRFPRKSDGPVEHGPLEGRATWYRIDALLLKNARAADKKPPYKNLKNFIEARCTPANSFPVITEKPKKLRRHGKKPLFDKVPEKDLLESIQAFFQKNGRRPQVLNGMIEDGPLAGKLTWGGINALILRESQRVDNPKYTTLAEFMDLDGRFDKKYGRLQLNARNLFNALSNHITETKSLPPGKGLEKLGDFKMADIRKAFRQSSLPGLEDYTRDPAKPPASLNEFLLETGLARRDGTKLLPTPSVL